MRNPGSLLQVKVCCSIVAHDAAILKGSVVDLALYPVISLLIEISVNYSYNNRRYRRNRGDREDIYIPVYFKTMNTMEYLHQ